MSDNEAEKLILVGFTNPYQIRYAQEDYGGSFYPDAKYGCSIPLYMLKRHENRLHTGEQLASTIADKDAELAKLKATLADRDAEIAELVRALKGIGPHSEKGKYGVKYSESSVLSAMKILEKHTNRRCSRYV